MPKLRIFIIDDITVHSGQLLNAITENQNNSECNISATISYDDAFKLLSDPIISAHGAKKFGISNANGENMLVHINQVCSIEASNKHCKFYCYDKEKNKYLTVSSNESFGKVLERLPKGMFIQCSKSWIVNPEYICNIMPNKKNGGVIKSEHPSCETIPYSDNFKNGLHEKFNLYKI